jgi:inner membrane protein
MDPLTQGVLGAVAAQQLAKPKVLLSASVLGFFSGMAADLDTIFRSNTDPLLALEFHRQFTHALIFIPVGGLICAVFFFFLFRGLMRRLELQFLQVWLFCTMGYATHGLLDACTTYGTQLLWPFSHVRVAWNTVSIIDPLYTLPVLFFMLLALIYRSKKWAIMAICWVIFYSVLGVVQRERAESLGWQLVQQRGHQAVSVEAKPSFANIMVWKIVYTTDTHFYVDAVRIGWRGRYYQGHSVPRLDLQRDFPWLENSSQQARDIERFRWFSNGYIAVSPMYPNRIIDIRYSLIPNEIRGLWGIELDKAAIESQHIRYVADRGRDKHSIATLWSMILGRE